MSIERTPVARPNRTRRSRGALPVVIALAGTLVLTGCGKDSVPGEGSAVAATATTTTEPTTTTTTPTETTTTTTTTSEQPSTSTEIVTKPTLCDLPIADVLPSATCRDVTSEGDSNFSTVLEAVEFQSGAGTARVKVIEDHGEFQTPAKYGATNVQFEERKLYGLADFNTLCSPDACYAIDTTPEESEGMGSVIYEVAGGDQHLDLTLLGRVATGANN